jgi:hypothetical protein
MSLESLTFATDGKRLERISPSSLAYLGQRARNNCYDFVLKRFDESDMTKAELARRMGKSQSQINHMLASPANWTVRTVAELLAAISDEEFIPNARPLRGRKPRNQRQEDFHRPEATLGSGGWVAAITTTRELADQDG